MVAWITLTYATADAESPGYKATAGRHLARFMAKLRKELGGRGSEQVEYATTYELQKRGRLHLNVIVTGWRFIKAAKVAEMWGQGIITVALVRDDKALGVESAKVGREPGAGGASVKGLGAYLAKVEDVPGEGPQPGEPGWDQVPGPEWGRRVSYSAGWPKVPKRDFRGHITWRKLDAEQGEAVGAAVAAGELVKAPVLGAPASGGMRLLGVRAGSGGYIKLGDAPSCGWVCFEVVLWEEGWHAFGKLQAAREAAKRMGDSYRELQRRASIKPLVGAA